MEVIKAVIILLIFITVMGIGTKKAIDNFKQKKIIKGLSIIAYSFMAVLAICYLIMLRGIV